MTANSTVWAVIDATEWISALCGVPRRFGRDDTRLALDEGLLDDEVAGLGVVAFGIAKPDEHGA
jgi:hypothetical protein